MEQPLAGVTALDFGQIYNGPYCGFLLAQAGARVIKVESPLGEPLRARGEPSAASYPFALLNAGKESITLNIKSAAGQAALKRMAREVDVVLENFAPGTMDRYGVGASALRQENPRLIYAAGTGYGATGPHRDYLGMDITHPGHVRHHERHRAGGYAAAQIRGGAVRFFRRGASLRRHRQRPLPAPANR